LRQVSNVDPIRRRKSGGILCDWFPTLATKNNDLRRVGWKRPGFLGEALEEVEGPRAKERQGRPGKVRSGKFTEHRKGETHEIIGKAIGMSGPTFQRAD
jgi:hypothetical protein